MTATQQAAETKKTGPRRKYSRRVDPLATAVIRRCVRERDLDPSLIQFVFGVSRTQAVRLYRSARAGSISQ